MLSSATPFRVLAAGSTNATVLKASPGALWDVECFHINDAPVYVHFYNLATTPDENSTPVFTLAIPANSTAANGAGNNASFPSGKTFTVGIAYRIVKGIATASTTAVDASEVLLSGSYS